MHAHENRQRVKDRIEISIKTNSKHFVYLFAARTHSRVLIDSAERADEPKNTCSS